MHVTCKAFFADTTANPRCSVFWMCVYTYQAGQHAMGRCDSFV